MSISFKKKSIKRAILFNQRGNYTLPDYVLSRYPSLGLPRDSEDFSWAVMQSQIDMGFRDEQVDGCLGNQTYTQLLHFCNPVSSDYIIKDSCRIQMPIREEYKLITFDEPGGWDLHRYGKFNKRREDISAICMHWGGLDAQHCFHVFATEGRDVSSHFLIGKDSGGKVVIYQVIDLGNAAWHAGHINQWTIGVDICQAPDITWLQHYSMVKRGIYDVKKIDNPTNRGPKKVLSLDPVLANAARIFIQDLAAALNLPIKSPPTHDVYAVPELRKYTLIGHHHSNHRKYDVACWWSDITTDPIAKGSPTKGSDDDSSE